MLTPEDIKEYFYGSQVLIGILFFASIFIFRGSLRDNPSQFNELGSSKPPEAKEGESDDLLAHARYEQKPETKVFQLSGIRIDGAAHEVLGVSDRADEKAIQKAYRDLMKRYHPDLVGPPGSREWKDAQRIAEAINLAKDEMLKTLRSRRSS